ncbi:hypothetical protein [Paenibacillus luteus]|uniref:hypothetical protein n=1 Tax=Paenibacillus luteus TaxID=2545753 RepID=UPI0019D5A72A|nr:hypothetical protein [Paenibacillus luteus]
MNNIASHKLLINGICISANFPRKLEADPLVQIDICSECFEPGCTTGGYVQVFEQDNYVIWKEPYDKDKANDVEPASGIRAGTIFWDSDQYAKFTAEFALTDLGKRTGLPIEQAIDLWRIQGAKTLFGNMSSHFVSIERLEEDIIGFYSKGLSAMQSESLYLDAKKKLLSSNPSTLTIAELTERAVKITAILDVHPYKEWDCIYVENEKVLYPIFGNLAFRLGE